MAMTVKYIAYIDESGDDGLMRVRPIDLVGASEWFVLSAVVVPVESNREAVWVEKILSDLGLHQRHDLHFQPLDDHHRLSVCKALASLPIRCFAVVSNKRNMRRYRNPKAEKVSYSAGRTWFYWWMTRLLLERVTDYCERRSLHEYGKPNLVRIEFARRSKDFLYAHCQGYLFWLRMQSKADVLYLKEGDLKWSTVDPINEIRVFYPIERAGLQLADVVAGAFFQAVTGKPEFAMALEHRMAFNAAGDVFGYGLKLMPTSYLSRARARGLKIFDFYLDQKKRQAPGS
jgi:Protein of unknown function (DUF3800)